MYVETKKECEFFFFFVVLSLKDTSSSLLKPTTQNCLLSGSEVNDMHVCLERKTGLFFFELKNIFNTATLGCNLGSWVNETAGSWNQTFDEPALYMLHNMNKNENVAEDF